MISPPPRNNTFAWVTGSPRIWLVSFWEVCGVIRFWNQTMNISNQEPWGCGRFAGNYGTNPKPMTSLTASNEGYTLQVMSTPSSYPLPRSWLMIKKWWCWWSRDSMFPPFPRGGCPISGKWRMMARGSRGQRREIARPRQVLRTALFHGENGTNKMEQDEYIYICKYIKPISYSNLNILCLYYRAMPGMPPNHHQPV